MDSAISAQTAPEKRRAGDPGACQPDFDWDRGICENRYRLVPGDASRREVIKQVADAGPFFFGQIAAACHLEDAVERNIGNGP